MRKQCLNFATEILRLRFRDPEFNILYKTALFHILFAKNVNMNMNMNVNLAAANI